MLLILGKHASSSHETSPGSDEDSCEDFLQEEEEEEEEDEDDDDSDDHGDDDKNNQCYKEEYKNKICNLPLPAQRDIEDLLEYVSGK
jgi:hypothetical protein